LTKRERWWCCGFDVRKCFLACDEPFATVTPTLRYFTVGDGDLEYAGNVASAAARVRCGCAFGRNCASNVVAVVRLAAVSIAASCIRSL
jgi:hypothetical protein